MYENLIITSAFGYSAQQLAPFLKSADQHVPNTNIVIFSDNEEKEYVQCISQYNKRARVVVPRGNKIRTRFSKYEKAKRVLRSNKFRNILELFPSLVNQKNFHVFGSFFFHVALARFIWTKSFLGELEPKPSMVLLSDSRDVFFQGDPFQDSRKHIVCGEEPITIGECPYNSHWIEYAFTKEIFNGLKDDLVLCSGVTLGKYDDVIAYVSAMVSEFQKNALKLIERNGLDQGIHNKILQMDKVIPYATSPNGDELIATLNYSNLEEFLFQENLGLLTKEGRLVKIVHQYDRHANLAEWVQETYK